MSEVISFNTFKTTGERKPPSDIGIGEPPIVDFSAREPTDRERYIMQGRSALQAAERELVTGEHQALLVIVMKSDGREGFRMFYNEPVPERPLQMNGVLDIVKDRVKDISGMAACPQSLPLPPPDTDPDKPTDPTPA